METPTTTQRILRLCAVSKLNINTLIWDLDGTLVDSVIDIAGSVNHVLQSYQLPVLPVDNVRQMIGNGASKLLQRAFASVDGLDFYGDDQAYDRFLDHYADHCCENTILYPGMAAMLSVFAELGCRQGVCTNKPQAMAKSIISHLQLTDTFGAIVGGDSTPHRKPHAEPLLHCLEILGAEASDSLMIGDSAADVGVARSAEIPVVVLPWGYTPNGVEDLGADYIAHDAQALKQLLHTLTGRS